MIKQNGFEIEVLAEVAVDAEIPVPGGCNSGSCSSCSNDAAEAEAPAAGTET